MGLWPDAAEAVGACTSLVVWLEGGSRSPAGLPFTSFLTDLAPRRFLPGLRFAEPSRYALQEALYQEALHQWLNEARRTVDHFVPGPAGRSTLVHVPWHATWWSAGRCLRALFVHAHLAPMRAAALHTVGTRADRELLAHAARSAPNCAWNLLDGLTAVRHVLSPAGAELLDGIHGLLLRPVSQAAS